jgi:hypothetical protein
MTNVCAPAALAASVQPYIRTTARQSQLTDSVFRPPIFDALRDFSA